MSRPPAAAASFDALLARLEAGMAAPAPHADPCSASGPGLPDWLWQVIAVLYDGQDAAAAAKDWALRLHDELGRLGGRVPFAVVHDWHARAVAPMLAEACARRGLPRGPQEAVRDMHVRALAGERPGEAEWEAVLEPALREAYRLAYAYAEAFAQAYAGAHAYAVANAYGEGRAAEFASGYAELNTGANAASFAVGNALANAGASAAAWAAADAHAYAEAWPFAHVRVYAHAWAGRDGTAAPDEADAQARWLRAAYRRLADGLVECLARAAA
ncbi:SpcZ [Streptomyces dangxiongensis]|uniref:SpcZ n=1 Tax=Streptomyces dangxiongensis TaxID=1442032 RepID=A0A3G2JQG9_9ACTN|nr:SpcZ [Streptomyces dangxiongensis]AYN43229.1 SpcZ [Streptomyces dangxiongensis]